MNSLSTTALNTESLHKGILPKRVDRKCGAALITHLHFPISARTLERWPLQWRRVNGRALVETSELLAEAQRRLNDAPSVMGG